MEVKEIKIDNGLLVKNIERFSEDKKSVKHLLCLFLRNDFLAVIVAAILADAVRDLQLVAMRALYERSRRRLVVGKTLVRSALRLLCLGDCHLSHLFVIHFPIARTPRKEAAAEAQTSPNRAGTH